VGQNFNITPGQILATAGQFGDSKATGSYILNIVKGLESKTEKVPVIQEPDKDKGCQQDKGKM